MEQSKKQISEPLDRRKNTRTGGASWGLNLIQKTILGTAVTSIAAGIASGLFAAYHFNNTAPFGLLGNILAMPVISLIIMPFAVLSMLLMPFYLEWIPLQIMGAGISLMKQIAYLIASIAPEGNPGMMTAFTMIIFSLALLVAVIATTRLKLAAIPLCMIGVLSFVIERNPDVIISEDAKLVAILDHSGALAVNRNRPSQFTVNNWHKSYKATQLIKPLKAVREPNTEIESTAATAFNCEEGVCLYNLSSSRILAYTDNPDSVETACNIADVVILAVPAQYAVCQTDPAILITKQDLALRGTLELRLSKNWLQTDISEEIIRNRTNSRENKKNISASNMMSSDVADIKYAVGLPQRPWQLYRLYSRAARGLPDM